jgi:hypothetical protein
LSRETSTREGRGWLPVGVAEVRDDGGVVVQLEEDEDVVVDGKRDVEQALDVLHALLARVVNAGDEEGREREV